MPPTPLQEREALGSVSSNVPPPELLTTKPHFKGGPRFENAMNAADTAWRRPPRPPRPRFLAPSILPALTIFLTAILQISASNSLHEHENRNSDLYCNKTLVSTSQCSLRTKTSLCHNGTHASSQLRALTPPEHFSTPLLDTLPTILHEMRQLIEINENEPDNEIPEPSAACAAINVPDIITELATTARSGVSQRKWIATWQLSEI